MKKTIANKELKSSLSKTAVNLEKSILNFSKQILEGSSDKTVPVQEIGDDYIDILTSKLSNLNNAIAALSNIAIILEDWE